MRRKGFVALVCLVLAGCSGALPQASFDQSASFPAVNSAQMNRILEQTSSDLKKASDGDTNALNGRLSDSALKIHQAQLAVQAAGQGEAPPINLSSDKATATSGPAFPRILVNVSKAESPVTPTLSVFAQNSPLSNYKMVQWVDLYPSSTIPSTAALNAGAQLVPPTATGYKKSPRDTVNAYVDFLANQDGKEKDTFADDKFASYISQTMSTTSQNGPDGKPAVQPQLKVERADGPILAVTTSDKGALVFASVRYWITWNVELEGTKIKTSGVTGAFLSGQSETDGQLSLLNLVTLAFAVPPEGDANKIKVLGATNSVIKAETHSWQELHSKNEGAK